MAITQQLDMQLTVGIDTHADVHVAVALDQFGRRLATCTIPTTDAGFTALLDWSKQVGSVERIGMQGAVSYGAGLARCGRRGLVAAEHSRVDEEVCNEGVACVGRHVQPHSSRRPTRRILPRPLVSSTRSEQLR